MHEELVNATVASGCALVQSGVDSTWYQTLTVHTPVAPSEVDGGVGGKFGDGGGGGGGVGGPVHGCVEHIAGPPVGSGQ